jgi:hypothetical protein
VDGLDFRPPDGEDWGIVCVHVDNFLFASWSATLQKEFNVWLCKAESGLKGES